MTTFYKYLKTILGAFAFISFFMAGCKPMQQLEKAPRPQLPDTFTGETDTASMANLPWKQLFTDPRLQQLIDTALNNNWDVQTAMQRVEIARANFQQTRGNLKPSVQAVASAGADRFGEYTMNGVGNFDTNLSGNLNKKQKIPSPLTPDFFVGLRSSWEIDLWDKLKNQKSAAYYRLLSSEQGIQLVKTILISEVACRYYELIALDNELKVLHKNIRLQESAVEIVQAQKMGGRATELAVQQFTAQLLRTQGLEASFQQQITETENELNILLGRLPQPIARGKSILAKKLPDVIHTGLPSALLLRRPDIRQAELNLRATEADVNAARAAFLPSLTLTPYLGLNSFNAAQLFNPASLAYGVAGGLMAPILNRTSVKSNYQRSLAATREALYHYQKTSINGFTEVVTNLSQMQNLQKKFCLKEQEARVLEDAVATAKDLYLAGFASYLEVITAQKNAVESELEMIATKKDIFLSLIHLYRSLGGGWK